ncbi:MAG: hypothetical protein IIU91_05780 [Alistipes sp.]|nr:hypothetical protein [Alistipes sp.]
MKDERGEMRDERGKMKDERGERRDERSMMGEKRGRMKEIIGERVKSFNPKTSVMGASCHRPLQVSHYSLLFQRYDF